MVWSIRLMKYTRSDSILWFAGAYHTSLGFVYCNGTILQSMIFIHSCAHILLTLFFLDEGNLNVSGIFVDEQNHAG